jgi:phosphatidylglycerophosphatase C
MIHEAFRGRAEAEVNAMGERFAREVLPGVFRPHALERVAWHEARGDEVVVVSASLGAYLGPLCSRMGWQRISSELEAQHGVLTGRYLGSDCTGVVKASRVRERFPLDRYAEVYAYGDTHEDDELLALANHRYFRWKRV